MFFVHFQLWKQDKNEWEFRLFLWKFDSKQKLLRNYSSNFFPETKRNQIKKFSFQLFQFQFLSFFFHETINSNQNQVEGNNSPRNFCFVLWN